MFYPLFNCKYLRRLPLVHTLLIKQWENAADVAHHYNGRRRWPKGPRKQTTEPILGTPILGTAILGTNQLQPVEWEGVAYCSSTVIGCSYMTWFFSPIKSTDTNCALLADKLRFPIQPVVTFFSKNRRFENRFCCLFSGSLGWRSVIIRIEIKMKSVVLLYSNLPRVMTNQIYHLAALRLGDQFDWSMTLGKLLDNNTPLFILFLKYADARVCWLN